METFLTSSTTDYNYWQIRGQRIKDEDYESNSVFTAQQFLQQDSDVIQHMYSQHETDIELISILAELDAQQVEENKPESKNSKEAMEEQETYKSEIASK